MAGLFDQESIYADITICPLHRDTHGIRWRSNRRKCCCPSSWASHARAKVERGIGLLQSHRLYVITAIIVPIEAGKWCLPCFFFIEMTFFLTFLLLQNLLAYFNTPNSFEHQGGRELNSRGARVKLRFAHKQTNRCLLYLYLCARVFFVGFLVVEILHLYVRPDTTQGAQHSTFTCTARAQQKRRAHII